MRKPISHSTAIATNGNVYLHWFNSTSLFKKETGEFDHFRIYRREESDFVFGQDYQEYFLALDNSNTELIFEGPLACTNGRKCVFEDTSVETSRTYAYFIQTKTSAPIGPIPVRVRDPEIWWSYAYLMQRLNALQNRAPNLVKLSVCGQTAKSIDIPCLRLGTGNQILGLVGLIHGGESGPELIVPALEHLLEHHRDLLQKVQVIALPSVNIDAREQQVQGVPWYIRKNHQETDINRNFPVHWEETEYGYGLDSSDETSATYRGPSPASAPETRAVLAAFQETRPHAVFCFHALASLCGIPALTAKYAKTDTDYTSRCKKIVEVFGKGLHPDLEYADNWLSFGCSAGSLPAWFYELNRIPAFDLEIGIDKNALDLCRTDRTDRALLRDYQERHARAIHAVLEHMVSEHRGKT
ncbi:MAG: M14 family metallopeptidase [bacterium]|nr:M14 family metallopeptidase [bacterium]